MILVTGASGLVGQHLLELLTQSGLNVRAIYRNTIPTIERDVQQDLIEWVEADVLNFPALELAFEGITHVYHCAAMVSYDPRYSEQMMLVNVEGTENIVNICLDKNIQKLVYVSSIAALGDELAGKVITEKSEIDEAIEHSAYAVSKQKAEMEVWRGIAEGLNAAIVNPSIILGEGNWDKSSSNLFKIVHKEFPFYTKGATGWVDVKDVVNIMKMLMESTITAERFILNGGNHSYKDVFTWMALAMNKKPPHKLASPWMTELVWRLQYIKSKLTGKIATITKETAKSAQEVKCYDNNKVKIALPNYQFSSVEIAINRIAKKYTN